MSEPSIVEMISDTPRADFLFDRANRGTPSETVFDDAVSIGFHYAFVAALMSYDHLQLRLFVVLLLSLAIAYFITRNIRHRHDRRLSVSFLRYPNDFLHRNFALLFCFYLTRLSDPALPVISVLLFGAAIDTFREYRIYSGGSGSRLDRVLSRIENRVQSALVPGWPFMVVAAVGLAGIFAIQATRLTAELHVVAEVFFWLHWLNPDLNNLPTTLARLNVADKYDYTVAAYGYLYSCSLLYLLLAFATQQKAQAGSMKWNKMTEPRIAIGLVCGLLSAPFLYYFCARDIDSTITFGLIKAFGTVQNGDTFVGSICFALAISTVWMAGFFFATGAIRRAYSVPRNP